ncbi:MAG: hypothetical protein ACI8V2_002116 [Candidatus Latescibacterota bacterium]|jgi:uncharacterized protein (DUF488 family)
MMYYRRKILLALVEAFGSRLKRTDCQKLLFLFCQYTKQNFYDFFPYKYGGFSFVSYQDKHRLATLGFLGTSEDFEFVSEASFVDQLKPKDQTAIKAFAVEMDGVKGNKLIKRVYLEFPHYACQSTILSEVLDPEEIETLRFWWCADTSSRLFTIGYEGKSIDAYLNLLIANNVKALVDVRKNPLSMKYGFSKTKLRTYIERAGLCYYHLPGLGIPSDLRRNLDSPEDYQDLFAYYRTEILPEQMESLEDIKMLLDRHTRIALTCFEKDHHSCHRNEVTQYLTEGAGFNTKVAHL